MVDVSASVNLPKHHKVQKFSSGTSSPGWSRKKGCKTIVVVTQLYSNNVTNLHHLTTHITTVLPHKMEIVLRPQICDVTSPNVYQRRVIFWNNRRTRERQSNSPEKWSLTWRESHIRINISSATISEIFIQIGKVSMSYARNQKGSLSSKPSINKGLSLRGESVTVGMASTMAFTQSK